MQLKTNTKNPIPKPKIVGILNATPDSFFDGGRFCNVDSALRHAEQLVKDGADIIDVGGESTRPGYVAVDYKTEIARTKDIICAIVKEFKNVTVSIDTYKSTVAQAAIDVGATMVNDVWGLAKDSNMASVVAKNNVEYVLGHNSETHLCENNFLSLVSTCFKIQVDTLLKIGVKKDKIILDPGIGFGHKSLSQNIKCITEIDYFKALGYPIYIGASNKSFLGKILGDEKADRLSATIAANLLAVQNGATYIRVHDVKAHADAFKTLDALNLKLKNVG